MKLIILVNLSGNLGGAEIRHLNLFSEISKRRNDYFLVINQKLYSVALKADLIRENNNILILQVDSYIEHHNNSYYIKESLKIKNRKFLKPFRFIVRKINVLIKWVRYIYKLHIVIKKTKPDYVYSVWNGGMLAWPLKYIHNFKFVYSYMDSGFSSLGSFWNNPLKSEVLPLKHADVIDFLSEDLYKGVNRKTKISKKTKIAITTCSFKNYDNIKPIKHKENTVTFCSRMTAIKNPMLLLESILIFNNSYSNSNDVIFQLLGDGECIDQMKVFISEKKLMNVELLGFVNKPVQYLCKSKIFVSIQQSNNYPSQSLLEAMACENAIIASDVGETRKLVTENEGILVDLNAQSIANAIIELIENNEKRLQLGKNARNKVLTEHTVEKYLDYFYSLESL